MFGVFTYGAYDRCLDSLFGELFMACVCVRLCGGISGLGALLGFDL